MNPEYERRLSEMEKSHTALKDKVFEMDKELAVTTTSILQTLKGFEKIPDALNAVVVSMNKMQSTINENGEKTDNLTDQLNALNTKVDKIDDEGKFNIRTYIKDNWALILAFLVLVGVYFKNIV